MPFLVAGVSFLSRQYLEDKGAAASTGKAISTKVSYYHSGLCSGEQSKNNKLIDDKIHYITSLRRKFCHV